MNKIGYAFKSFLEMAKKASKKGKPLLIIMLDMLWCGIRYGASPRNYYWFGFYELSPKQRKSFVTHMLSEKIQKKCNRADANVLFENKQKFYSEFSEFMNRKVIDVTSIKCADELRTLGSKVIFKPLEGSEAKGIKVIELDKMSYGEIVEMTNALPRGVIEEWIVQHNELNKFCSCAVNIIRIVTARRGEKFSILASTLAVAKTKPYANASADAVFANIDADSGVVISDGCDYDEIIYKCHPISNVEFKGFQVPFWKETVEMLQNATKVVPDVGYIGWDVAITPNGPVIIEGNNNPGYEWMQLRMINPEGIGKKREYSILLQED